MRAVIMMACLIAIPLAALFGRGVPDFVKQLLQQHLGLNIASAAASLPESPVFIPSGHTQGVPTATPVNTAIPGALAPAGAAAHPFLPPMSPPGNVAPVPVGPCPAPTSEQTGSMVIPVGYQGPVAGAPGVSSPAGAASVASEAVVGAAGPQSAELAPPPSVYQRRPDLVPVQPADSLAQLHARFRQLGATYSLLESWGAQGDQYRFYCKMAIGGSSTYTRYFEAIDCDPLRVMTTVLREVEAWRAGEP